VADHEHHLAKPGHAIEVRDFGQDVDRGIGLFTGTGTPVPGGFTYYQAKEALQEIAKKGGKIVGYEFVEVEPEHEVFETSSRMAARLIMDFLGAIFKHQGHMHPQPAAPTSGA
jgi:hypothetical protein